jgi:hypothetical protein
MKYDISYRIEISHKKQKVDKQRKNKNKKLREQKQKQKIASGGKCAPHETT